MREPPITVTCDCGSMGHARYGERWSCPTCGKTWDTSQIPPEDYANLLRSVRRYRLYILGPPLALCAVLVPLAVLVGFQYGFLLFFLLLAWSLLAVPKLRERASRSVMRNRATWELRPE